MNRLAKFRAQGKKVTLRGDDKELEIKGLTFPELADFSELIETKKMKESLDFLLYTTLRKAIPTKEDNPAEGMTEEEIREEIKNMDSGIAMEIIKILKEVSNLPDATEESKKKIEP